MSIFMSISKSMCMSMSISKSPKMGMGMGIKLKRVKAIVMVMVMGIAITIAMKKLLKSQKMKAPKVTRAILPNNQTLRLLTSAKTMAKSIPMNTKTLN
jgi:hypothetical protein